MVNGACARSRNPSKISAREWASRGVQVVQGDVDDIESLNAAFAGAHAIFAMTDYWPPLSDPTVRAEAAKRGISPEEQCAEIKIQRGKNIALAARTSEVQKTLERFVYSSLGNHSKLSGGRYTQVWHCDSKAAVEQFIREDSLLRPKSSFIHVGFYADNWKRIPLDIKKDPVGVGYWHIDIDDGRKPLPIVWTRRDTGPLVKRLVEDVQPGTRLLGLSQIINYRDIMAI